MKFGTVWKYYFTESLLKATIRTPTTWPRVLIVSSARFMLDPLLSSLKAPEAFFKLCADFALLKETLHGPIHIFLQLFSCLLVT